MIRAQTTIKNKARIQKNNIFSNIIKFLKRFVLLKHVRYISLKSGKKNFRTNLIIYKVSHWKKTTQKSGSRFFDSVSKENESQPHNFCVKCFYLGKNKDDKERVVYV